MSVFLESAPLSEARELRRAVDSFDARPQVSPMAWTFPVGRRFRGRSRRRVSACSRAAEASVRRLDLPRLPGAPSLPSLLWLLCVPAALVGCVVGVPKRATPTEAALRPPAEPDQEGGSAARTLHAETAAPGEAPRRRAPRPPRPPTGDAGEHVWVDGAYHWDGVRHVWVPGRWEPRLEQYRWSRGR